ncbi:MAG: BamA/TamA family outer membrane protein, partial [Betaproteobacteria bacterium]|nr:BamA/TamA family outer membrane protein [Betaproteobacteria bacterium]
SYEKVEVSGFGENADKFLEKHGSNFDLLKLKMGLVHDTRDSFQQPTDGQRVELNTNLGLPILDLSYYQADYEHDLYYQSDRIFGKPVWHARAGFGLGDGYGGDIFPFYNRYYVGGTDSLRGFESNSIGGGGSGFGIVGGLSRAYASIEAAVDLNLFKTQKVYLAPFADAGIVGKEPFGNFQPLRSSVGLEIRWISPIGPLRFSWARALLKEDGDQTQGLQFSVRY